MEERTISRTTKAVFGNPQMPKAKISTNLYDRVSLEFATAEGDRRASRIQGSNGVQGWLVIEVRDAAQKRRKVVYSPEEHNPYHAEIIIPDEHAESWEDAIVHLLEFLSLSRWEDRASPMS